MRQLSTRGQDEQPASPRENWIYYSKMAHRELQGRLQIAEQQVKDSSLHMGETGECTIGPHQAELASKMAG